MNKILVAWVITVAGAMFAAAGRLPDLQGLALLSSARPQLPFAVQIADEQTDPWIIVDDVVITEPMDVANIIVAENGSLTVLDVPEPGFRVAGNLWAIGDGEIHLEDSVIRFLSTYHGQYALAGAERGHITVTGCDYRVTDGIQHGLFVAGEATMVVEDTDFNDVQLLTAEQARMDASRLDGRFEVIVQNDSTMNLADIPRTKDGGEIWVWVEFGVGSDAVYTPPMPGFVDSWSFPPTESSGINQHVTVTRCDTLLWPMLVREGSRLVLRDIPEDNWIVVGLHLPNNAIIYGMQNGISADSESIQLVDREIRLERASVDTWNLYPQDNAKVMVRDSLLGEVLSMGQSYTHILDTTIDGTGGFFGARDTSTIVAERTTVTCTLEASQNATLEMHHGFAKPYPIDTTGAFTRAGAYDEARLLLDHTPLTSTPVVGGQGAIGVTWWGDPPPGAFTQPGQPIWGTAAVFGLTDGPVLSRWRLERRSIRTGRVRLLAEGRGNFEEQVLAVVPDGLLTEPHEDRLVLTDSWDRVLTGWQWYPGGGGSRPIVPRRTGGRLPR